MEKEILDLFKVMIVRRTEDRRRYNLDYAELGFVTDFDPTLDQLMVLKKAYKPLEIRTLFTKEERDNADINELITKQILHYIEIYGLDTPGLFELEVSEGKIAPITFVRGVSTTEFQDMVRKLLYANAPVKDSETLRKIIQTHNVEYNVNQIANNELRITLFDPFKHTFDSGDDAVRYLCYTATQDPLLIKSGNVIENISDNILSAGFFENHKLPLAQVFNRHKKLIMAAKGPRTRTIINQISRLSKTQHVPIREHVSKRFISSAIKDQHYDFAVLNKIAVRDKFKYLNLLEYKKSGLDTDVFVIRNGKSWVETDRKVLGKKAIERVEYAVLRSLMGDLGHLEGQHILLDKNVDFGLPISRKQTIGQLPFGTKVTVDGKISSGMYWENDWGARDLDLSTIDTEGNRTGWGQWSGYDKNNPVTFSGDLTDATDGAMEFMTSSNQQYGLFVNIYSGQIGSEMELVIGTATKKQWIKDPIIRERYKLSSRGCIIGFVNDQTYTVYAGRLSRGRMSGEGNRAIVVRGTSDFWTVSRIFDALGIKYDLDRHDDVDYNHELRYRDFTYDKLEALLLP